TVQCAVGENWTLPLSIDWDALVAGAVEPALNTEGRVRLRLKLSCAWNAWPPRPGVSCSARVNWVASGPRWKALVKPPPGSVGERAPGTLSRRSAMRAGARPSSRRTRLIELAPNEKLKAIEVR